MRPVSMAPEEANLKQLNAVLDSAEANSPAFDYFSARLSGSANLSGNSMNFRGALRMKKDSIVWISVTPSFTPGLEVARLVVTPDSLLLINRMQREYCLESFSSLEQITGVNISFSAFQKLFTGTLPKIQARDNWELAPMEHAYIIREKPHFHSSELIEKGLRQEYHLLPGTFMLARLFLEQTTPVHRTLTINYSEFDTSDGYPYPQNIEGTLSGSNPMRFEIKYRGATYDGSETFPVRINPGYEKVNLN